MDENFQNQQQQPTQPVQPPVQNQPAGNAPQQNMPQYTYPAPAWAPVCKWNWGAFFQSILFGFANKAWMTFLCLIPFFNFVWIFVCGAKGEEWAWKSGEFQDEGSFHATMKSWNRAGLLSLIILAVVVVIWLIAGASMLIWFQNIGSKYRS
jgi:hypothetical protein